MSKIYLNLILTVYMTSEETRDVSVLLIQLMLSFCLLLLVLFLVLFSSFTFSRSDNRKQSTGLPALLNTDCNQQHSFKLGYEACKANASSCQATVLFITWKAVIIPVQRSQELLKLK